MLLSILAACPTMHTGQLTTDVQLVPSTIPVASDGYQLGPWVEAEGCDYVNTDLRVADLVYQAQGDYDALINVTVEHYEDYTYLVDQRNRFIPSSQHEVGSECYRVHGQAVRLIHGPERLPTADP